MKLFIHIAPEEHFRRFDLQVKSPARYYKSSAVILSHEELAWLAVFVGTSDFMCSN
jgi:polyphosphate kinase 2 (PPK2 family)